MIYGELAPEWMHTIALQASVDRAANLPATAYTQ